MYTFELRPALRARYVLLGVSEFDENPCLRFDLSGCLAPMTQSQLIPLELQVGWNSSVPTCIDTEPPKFSNCPQEPIYAQVDANGQLLPINYNVPVAVDNSGRVAWTRVEPENFEPPRFVTQDTDILYTAFDEAGNWAQCVVELRIPDTRPPVMKCPDSYSVKLFC